MQQLVMAAMTQYGAMGVFALIFLENVWRSMIPSICLLHIMVMI